MNTNSQSCQDILATKLIKNKTPYFVDIGCWKAVELNNTFALEKAGWKGISIDILDMENDWLVRKTPFVQGDALTLNYKDLFDKYEIPNVVDYLSIDIEGDGLRFIALKKVFESNKEFALITIEHDAYRGYEKSEAIPQREFLTNLGYTLICKNVKCSGNPFEDWWINPKLIEKHLYEKIICENEEYADIIKILENTNN